MEVCEIGFISPEQWDATIGGDGLQKLYDSGIRQVTAEISPDTKEYFDSREWKFVGTTSRSGPVRFVMSKALEFQSLPEPEIEPPVVRRGPHNYDKNCPCEDCLRITFAARHGQESEHEIIRGGPQPGNVGREHQVIGNQGSGPRSSGYAA